MKLNKQLLMGTALLLLGSLCTLPTLAGDEKLPAFPGAEGFGRYVTGGRGGNVYHVTKLTNAGTGSLRWALNQPGPRIIVFDVSGTIHLTAALNIQSNTTIAGQTAPGDGICIADYPCTITGNNVIVRYMRFRLGNKNVTTGGADGWDGFGGYDQMNWMIDHCSVSWSIDECLSVLGNKNTTVQWCLVAQSLVNAGHNKGAHGYGGNWGGSGASFHHNLLAHHTSRTPRLGPRPTTQLDERMDMRNNVIYNFGGNGCYGGEGMDVNIVNNYYKPGPGSPTGTKGKRIAGIGIRTNSYIATYPDYAPALHKWGHYYVTGNVNFKYSDVTNDNWKIGVLDQVSASDCDGTWTQVTRDTIKLEEPIYFITTTTHSAEDAYNRVLDYVGCSLHRDSFDEMIIGDTRIGKASHTGSGLSYGFINTQDDNKPSGASSTWSAWPELASETAPVDTDGDGMPDEWETAHGLNPNNKADGNELDASGYTNVEVYLNSLVAEITEKQNEGGVMMGSIREVDEPLPESFDISQQTSNGDGTFVDGFKLSGFSSSNQPAYGSSGTIKLSSNKQYTITIPEGITISKATILGYCNADGVTGYLGELAGTTYGETDYVFPARDANPSSATHTITFEQSIASKLTFTPKGNGQACYKITLHTATTTGIKEMKVVPVSDNKCYNLQGVCVANPTKGVYIQNGKKIVMK